MELELASALSNCCCENCQALSACVARPALHSSDAPGSDPRAQLRDVVMGGTEMLIPLAVCGCGYCLGFGVRA